MISISYKFVATLLLLVNPVLLQEKFNIAESINKFTVDLLAATNNEAGDSLNIALSPLTLWTIFSIISEGALEGTASQFDRALGQPQNKNIVRDSYQRLAQTLQDKSDGAEFESSSGIFTDNEFPVKDKIKSVAKQYYNTTTVSVDFKKNYQEAANFINKYVATATRNRIPNLVLPNDMQNAQLFVTSTMYFKGQWQVPFNKSATQRNNFFDEKKNKIGEVNMMYQVYPFPYSRIDKLKAFAVEFPYGFDDKYSMLVLLPRASQTVREMLNLLTRDSLTEILARLEKSRKLFPEEDVHVYFPKFKIVSDFNMNKALEDLGIVDIFDPKKANLLGMFPHYVYLSRAIQKAEIEVDEEGTVATAAGGTLFLNRAPPPVFTANKPFLYFIIHKATGTAVFAGKLSNPNTLN